MQVAFGQPIAGGAPFHAQVSYSVPFAFQPQWTLAHWSTIEGMPAPAISNAVSTFSHMSVRIVPDFASNLSFTAYSVGEGVSGSGGAVPALRMPLSGSGDLELVIEDGLGGAVSVLVMGTVPADIPLLPGVPLLCAPPYATELTILTGSGAGQGTAAWSWSMPLGSLPFAATWQVFSIDPAAASGISASNGLDVAVE